MTHLKHLGKTWILVKHCIYHNKIKVLFNFKYFDILAQKNQYFFNMILNFWLHFAYWKQNLDSIFLAYWKATHLYLSTSTYYDLYCLLQGWKCVKVENFWFHEITCLVYALLNYYLGRLLFMILKIKIKSKFVSFYFSKGLYFFAPRLVTFCILVQNLYTLYAPLWPALDYKPRILLRNFLV